ncbi:MAG: DUF3108 domain-containing protein [Chloroflexi bacterium]|nr:MAG: DUF3108 domain-containing protein [Chloroflexota bacterium]
MQRILPLILTLVLLAACSGSDELVAQDVLSQIPWSTPETAHYRLLHDDDAKGSGELKIAMQDGALVLAQTFDIPDQKIADTVQLQADAQNLRPKVVQRTIDGPEGKRDCTATYEGNSVTVEQQAKDENRRDNLSVPAQHYDSWSDLFLWRTLKFFENEELKYVDVLTCSLTKPDLLPVVLQVKSVEEVSVPAGRFQAWRLEIRSGGRTQKAWYADDAAHTLVRYDNGDLVFELESLS